MSSTVSDPKIFITGASGYIGGTILTDLLRVYKPQNITAIARKPEDVSVLQSLGINAIEGAMDNAELLKKLASENDVVINNAVAFGGDEASIQAIVDGLESRATATSTKPVYIHTGGSGTVMYGSDGEAGTDVWTDEQYDRWASLPDGSFFYGGFKIAAAAAAKGVISSYILLSPTVYGKGTGLGNKLSLQLPAYTRYAKTNKQAAYIGKGDNIWGNVHIQDLSDLYLLVIKHALSHPDQTAPAPQSNGWGNIIYTGADQHQWKPVIELLGDLLHARGDVDKPSAKSIGEGEGILYMFGGNSFLAVSEKAKALGWKPQQKPIMESMKEALPAK